MTASQRLPWRTRTQSDRDLVSWCVMVIHTMAKHSEVIESGTQVAQGDYRESTTVERPLITSGGVVAARERLGCDVQALDG